MERAIEGRVSIVERDLRMRFLELDFLAQNERLLNPKSDACIEYEQKAAEARTRLDNYVTWKEGALR